MQRESLNIPLLNNAAEKVECPFWVKIFYFLVVEGNTQPKAWID